MKQKKAHATHPVGNRTVIGIICIVVALAICFGIAPLVNRLSDGKTKIVRLIRDISAGATITEADIEVADVGSYNLPTGVIKDKAQVVGKCALSNLTKGDYLFPSKIGNDTNNAGRMLESLDENHKAISITIGSFALGFSGKLETGDIVGILVYDQVENRSYTPKELAYVKVITTTTSSGVDKADVEDKSQPVTVTLLVNNEQAELLARLLQESEVLIPMDYWQSKGLGRGGKKTQPNPYKWCKTTIAKILAQQEYCGDIINFKTYSKSFRNKKRLDNPEENWAIFKNVHDPIIDRETFEMVQELVAKTKRRAPKKENGEKNMFCGLLYCADCGSPLWFNVNHPNKSIQYFNCSNYRANRGTCPSTHYIRADSIEQVVIAELQTIARFLDDEEDEFAAMLESKTNKDIATEQKLAESQLATARARVKEIERLYERIYEDNVNGKVSDEWFMKLSHKYEVEMDETKKNILALREKLDSLVEKRQTKENFVKAVRSFMEMKTLNPVILRELIEKIEVYQIEGTGKNRTQRVIIHYRFVGCMQIPEWYRKRKVTLESRQGVAVNYLPTTV